MNIQWHTIIQPIPLPARCWVPGGRVTEIGSAVMATIEPGRMEVGVHGANDAFLKVISKG